MSKKIQMTEEEWLVWINDNIIVDLCKLNNIKFMRFNKDETLKALRRNGYIKKSDLEILAENFYENNEMDVVPEFCLDYVEKLEEEIERLKNE